MKDPSHSESVGTKVAKATGIVTVALALGYVVSFLKTAIVAAYLGAGRQMDVFLWSYALISVFALALTTPLVSSLVPVYVSLKAKNERLAGDLFNAVMGFFFIAFFVVCLLL